MKTINVKTKLLDVYGKPIKDRISKEDQTLGLTIIGLLRAVNLGQDKENKIYTIMTKIAVAKDKVELDQDEFELLQEAVTKNMAKTQMGEMPILSRDQRGYIKTYLEKCGA